MRDFSEIEQLAADRKGGTEALAALLSQHGGKSPEELEKAGDDRWLAMFTKCIFQAGFNWKVIEAKWPGFEEAFDGFDPAKIALWPDEKLDALLSDTRVVRNGAKLRSVHHNAIFLHDLAREHGSASSFFANYPSESQADLLEVLKKRGSRLGGNTGQYALRFMGKESFILSRDVLAGLQREKVIETTGLSKKNMAAIQAAFNTWKGQSGRNMSEISRILAFSVGTPG